MQAFDGISRRLPLHFTVPGLIVGGSLVTPASIHVLNPTTLLSEKTYTIDCQAIPGVNSVSGLMHEDLTS